MSTTKHFTRSIRQDIKRISMSLKQMEFRILRMRGFVKQKLRGEIYELKRLKDSILHKLSKLTPETRLHVPSMQVIRDDMALLRERCNQLKAQHR